MKIFFWIKSIDRCQLLPIYCMTEPGIEPRPVLIENIPTIALQVSLWLTWQNIQEVERAFQVFIRSFRYPHKSAK